MASTELATIGQRVAHVRTIAGLSTRQTDKLAGLHRGHTSAIESSDDPNLETKTLRGLAELFGLSLDWLVDGKGRPPSARGVRESVATKQRAQAA